jgi:hypothetical protein
MIDRAGLQSALITNNASSVDKNDQPDHAPESVPNLVQHGQFCPVFRQIKDAEGIMICSYST